MAGGHAWRSAKLVRTYLTGVRGAIPLATEQIEVMLRVIKKVRPHLKSFLDLGCGDGILGRTLLNQFPGARGVLLDLSTPMLDAALQQSYAARDRLSVIKQDYGKREWVGRVLTHAPFDAIVSGFSIHHQPHARKRQIYSECFRLLKPGGVLINIEHVKSDTKLLSDLFDECFVDSLYRQHRAGGGKNSRRYVAQAFYNRRDKKENILAPLGQQCNWLRQIGFTHVDCYLKIFELAVFGGVKPKHGLHGVTQVNRLQPGTGKSSTGKHIRGVVRNA